MVVKKEKIDKPEKITFTCMGNCGKTKILNGANFYGHKNPIIVAERYPVCKECIIEYVGEVGSKGYDDRVMMMLRLLNRPFYKEMWQKAEYNWGIYIKNVSSLKRDYEFSDSIFSDKDVEQEKQFTVARDIKIEEEKEAGTRFYSDVWKGSYTQEDIDYLDGYYASLCSDFKVVTVNHKDYARKISKASLHMDNCFQQMLDGVAGADKRYKEAKDVFDTLSKSAQFSESQRGQNDVSLGGFGVTFDTVEKKKWIPKHSELAEDQYDKLLNDFAMIKESV